MTLAEVTLAEAVEGLYRAFSAHGRRAAITACPCCVHQAEQHTLAAVPLRELAAGELARYAFKAMTTWGEAEDYKHFLPRILELALTPAGRQWPGLELWLIADKLQLAAWPSWPPAEQTAVRDYLDAVWRHVLAQDPEESSWRAAEVLPAVGRLLELAPLLAAWEADSGLAASLQLADFIEAAGADLASDGHLDDAWEGVADRARVEEWLRALRRGRALEDAFARHLESPAAGRLAAAVDLWELLLAQPA